MPVALFTRSVLALAHHQSVSGSHQLHTTQSKVRVPGSGKVFCPLKVLSLHRVTAAGLPNNGIPRGGWEMISNAGATGDA